MCRRIYPPLTRLWTRGGKKRGERGGVGRVHAPEADMRATLPHRKLLLRSLQREDGGKWKVRDSLYDVAGRQVGEGDLEGYRESVRRALQYGMNGRVRGVAVGGVQAVARDERGRNEVMGVLEQEGVLDILDEDGVGMVMDVIIRGMLKEGRTAEAVRGERMSRIMESRLRRGTYSMLIQKSRLETGIGILHRAVAVGVEPNRRMWNAVLEVCLRYGDTDRARKVVREMVHTGGGAETVQILLKWAGREGVEAVWNSVRVGCAQVGDEFVKRFLREGDVGKAFQVVDEMGENGVVPKRESLERIVKWCLKEGKREAAMRGWREMRRNWLGKPKGRAGIELDKIMRGETT